MEIIKIKTDSIAHLSYLIINEGEAAVIDPRRDAEIYFEQAKSKGATIKYIFETHRNEDFVTGSRELKRYTGAEIYHGEGLDFKFGNFTKDNQKFTLGSSVLQSINTPGHTPESISIVVYPDKESKSPLAVFTGDTLFIGDVGRTDFFPDEMEKYAGMIYDSIHEKILPLGDQVVLFPAHGAGSVCGGGISDRELSTLGHEIENNPMLKLSREEFIEKKINETHQKPKYFKQMEKINLSGEDKELRNYESIVLISTENLKENLSNYQVIDVRSPEAFLGCHIPNSLSIPNKMIGAYAGYFLNYDAPIAIIADEIEDAEVVCKDLLNLGYDNKKLFLRDGISAWETSGEDLANIEITDANRVINGNNNALLLDVRKPSEWENGIIDEARTIFLGDIPNNIEEFSSKDSITAYCGSGVRATIAASILKRSNLNVKVFMGSMKAYKAYKK